MRAFTFSTLTLLVMTAASCGSGGRAGGDADADGAVDDVSHEADALDPAGDPSAEDAPLPDAGDDPLPDVIPDAEDALDAAVEDDPVEEASDPAIDCPSGMTDCGGTCVDLSTDRDHCGACGTACAIHEICSAGACYRRCDPGEGFCDGACRHIIDDPAYCGDCTTSCASTEVCSLGVCRSDCDAGLTDCSGSCRDLLTDPRSCGDCRYSCFRYFVTDATCSGGVCTIVSCGGYMADCDGDPTNGCEVDRRTDPENCGSCGTACSTGQLCVASTCVSPKRVFVTSATFRGDLGGSSGADALCATAASDAGLSGTWRAWVSGPSTAAGRFTHASVPYALLDGTKIADSWTDLTDGTLDAPIDMNELGSRVSASAVWTGTESDGGQPSTGANDCLDWSTGSSTTSGRAGFTDETGSYWTWTMGLAGLPRCNTSHRLYCFEQ